VFIIFSSDLFITNPRAMTRLIRVLYIRISELQLIQTTAILKFRFVFWDVLPCKIIVYRRFRGTCCLHHQGDVFDDSNPFGSRKPIASAHCPSAMTTPRYHPPLSTIPSTPRLPRGSTVVLFTHRADDGGSMYLWNVGWQLFYTAVHPRSKSKVKLSRYTPWRRLGGEEL
jgi:hypothetical protein